MTKLLRSLLLIWSVLSVVISKSQVKGYAPVLGVQKIGVIPFDYLQDGSRQPINELERGFFTSDFSIKRYIEEVSYGKASIEGVIYPYRTDQPALPTTGSSSVRCAPERQVWTQQPDVDYGLFDGVILLSHMEGTGCPAGSSSFGRRTFQTTDGVIRVRLSDFRTKFFFPHEFSGITNSTVAHELLHSFGVIYHSNSYRMADGAYLYQARGNTFDIMGLRNNSSHPNSLIKRQLGWLTDNEVKKVDSCGVYRIYALEKTLPGQTQCIVISLANDLDLQPDDIISFQELYLEYRGLTGFDSRTNRGVSLSNNRRINLDDPHGLSILGIDSTLNDIASIPVLIDMHPEPIGGFGASYGPAEVYDAPLFLNEVYEVADNDIEIEVINLSEGNYIDVRITMPEVISNISNSVETELAYVFPNPSENGIFYFNKEHSYKVFDLNGQLLEDGRNTRIDLSERPRGAYILTLGSKQMKLFR